MWRGVAMKKKTLIFRRYDLCRNVEILQIKSKRRLQEKKRKQKILEAETKWKKMNKIRLHSKVSK